MVPVGRAAACRGFDSVADLEGKMAELQEPGAEQKSGQKPGPGKTGALSQALPALYLKLRLMWSGLGAAPGVLVLEEGALPSTAPKQPLRFAEVVMASSSAACSSCARGSGSCTSTWTV